VNFLEEKRKISTEKKKIVTDQQLLLEEFIGDKK